MTISEAQLETWSHQGGTAGAQAAHLAIRNALNGASSPISGKDFEIYLQGSYRSDTNVRADSDVDIVVQLNSTFGYDLSALPAEQLRSFQTTFSNDAVYTWSDFRSGVLQGLRNYFGAQAVRERNKCLEISGAPTRVTADVVPAIEYRKYVYFYGYAWQSYFSGIRFHDLNGRTILNFPRPHYENGVKKNSENCTNGWFKPTVRMIKNARACAVTRGYLGAAVASSYFTDCLVWNVPDGEFGNSFQDTFCNIVDYLSREPLERFVCRNGLVPLFGTSQEQWSQVAAKQLIAALASLWRNW